MIRRRVIFAALITLAACLSILQAARGQSTPAHRVLGYRIENVAWRHDLAGPNAADSSIPVATGNGLVLARTESGLDAFDVRNGHLRWRVRGAQGASATYGDTVYVNVMLPGKPLSGENRPQLFALNASSGRVRWRAPGGFALDADARGIAVAGFDVAWFSRDGKQRWAIPPDDGQSYDQIIIDGDHLVTLGANMGGNPFDEIESFDIARAKRVGFALKTYMSLVALDAHFATLLTGIDLAEQSEWCRIAHVTAVALDSAYLNDPGSGARIQSILRESTVTYALTGPYASGAVCDQHRFQTPCTIVDGDDVVLGSGDVTALFRLAKPQRPLRFIRNATLVGGPFRGSYYVVRRDGLSALRWNRDRPTFQLLVPAPTGTQFAVAGLADRLYASDGAMTIAVDLRTRRITGRYRIACPQLHAIAHIARTDVLVCDNAARENAVSSVFAVPAGR